MIGLFALPALAADLTVDLLAVPVTAHTAVLSAGNETLDVNGIPSDRRAREVQSGLGSRGLSLELTGTPRGSNGWLITVGGRLENPSYRVETVPFAPVATELRAEVGGFGWFEPQLPRRVDGYGIATTGVQLSTLTAGPYGTVFAPAWATAFGMGIASRTGRARVRAEVRVDLAARTDAFSGRAQLVDRAFTWDYHPGSAAASVLVGGGWGPR